jgi:hypothetical protein
MMEAELENFWEKYAGADVVLWTYKDKDSVTIGLEDLYQQFKARMLAEMKAEAQEAQRRYMDIRMKVPRKPT